MKSYLDLGPIGAKVHKRQNRMTLFCIMLAVFLVTAIFGTADMFIRGQLTQIRQEKGNWHIAILEITKEDAALMAVRPEVKALAASASINSGGEDGYTLAGKQAVIMGVDEPLVTEMYDMLREGCFPQKENEVLLSINVRNMCGLEIGDEVVIQTPDRGQQTFLVSGFVDNTDKLLVKEQYGVMFSVDGFRAIYPESLKGELTDSAFSWFVQFRNTGTIRSAIRNIKEQFGLREEQVVENGNVLALLGQSSNSYVLQIYASAAVISLLVLCAGVLMIASSLNSNVVQRTAFFGLLRCIGAEKKQVMRLVRREALLWCRTAIPAGLGAGTVIVWGMVFVLKRLSPVYFGAMPSFVVSVPSLIAGSCIGLLTVLLAVRSPAKKASGVSPLAAVSGNVGGSLPVRKAANTVFFKVETAMGIHHALSGRKNFILMTGSFAFSIVLFLAFSVTMDFMRHAITPLKPWTPDILVAAPGYDCILDAELIETLRTNPAVKHVSGWQIAFPVPGVMNGEETELTLVSCDEGQLEWMKRCLSRGEAGLLLEEPDTGLVLCGTHNTCEVGDRVTIGLEEQQEIRITGILSSAPLPFTTDGDYLVVAKETFQRLTGETDYAIIDIQTAKGVTDREVNDIHNLFGAAVTFSDKRMGNESARGAFYGFGICVYGFLAIITMITIFHIINSVAMSVAARMRQYGVLRAVGLSDRQLKKMIVAEAVVYAGTGSILGAVLGIWCNKILFASLVTFRWGDVWRLPYGECGVILAVVLLSVLLAVHGPVRRIGSMSIVDTIGAQ